jgi:hypothetical protein
MRKIGIVSLVLGCLALGFLPRTGSAQASAVTVNVPFAFMVNDTKLGAGTYKIAQVENKSYMISDPKGEQKVMFTTETATMPKPAKSFTLIFNVYGDQYYLSKFFHQGKTSGCAIPQTAAEKELAQKVPVTTKTVAK